MSTTIEERAEAYKTKPRSVSQTKQYEQCPYAYFLARIAREPELQAAWLAQGVAVHSAAEEWEKSGRRMALDDAQAVYSKVYTRMANEALEAEPDEEGWQASGPYPGFTDLERRWSIGMGQVESYVDWYKTHPDETIWKSADGVPAIEQRFDIEVDGVKVIGFIDQVIEHPKHGPLVRDIKTGVIPKMDDTFQLDVYAFAMNKLYGLECKAGDYWSGKTGKPSRVRKLDIHTGRLEDVFGRMDEGVKSGDFTPRPDPEKCGRCPVQRSCEYAA
ncbi:RecB family exonuclease [Streptomyces yunnanensis]|uniref:RecB family exonuclease n=1 Tax=Streptomyces yunnanensis TaxID=156453 RepID=UPI00142D38ED|nr:PD-(D/E)XK nuclease family protein [Streptomyces yunnanensis]